MVCPDRGTPLSPQPSQLSARADPWVPNGKMPGRKTPQLNPWKGLIRGPVNKEERIGEPKDEEGEGGKSKADSVGELLAREVREQKATKSDKAPVRLEQYGLPEDP